LVSIGGARPGRRRKAEVGGHIASETAVGGKIILSESVATLFVAADVSPEGVVVEPAPSREVLGFAWLTAKALVTNSRSRKPKVKRHMSKVLAVRGEVIGVEPVTALVVTADVSALRIVVEVTPLREAKRLPRFAAPALVPGYRRIGRSGARRRAWR
jgi:hypothetical protein